MPYQKGDEKKYFGFVVTLLLIIASIIGYFLYNYLVLGPQNIDGEYYLNPNGKFPENEPFVSDPDSPPPN